MVSRILIAVLTVLAVSAQGAQACGGGLFAGRVKATVSRVGKMFTVRGDHLEYRTAQSYQTYQAYRVVQAPTVTVVQAPATYAVAPPVVTGPVVDVEARARIAAIEKALTDGGRALMFRDPPTVSGVPYIPSYAPQPMLGPATTVRVTSYAAAPRVYGYTVGQLRVFGAAVSAGRSANYQPVAPFRRALVTLGSVDRSPDCP